jgi:hypothetical protein
MTVFNQPFPQYLEILYRHPFVYYTDTLCERARVFIL